MKKKKPKILVVANNKGGVGKSLISQLIATYIAFKKNKKVLALDFDPQGNMSYRFLRDTRIRDMSSYKPPMHPEYDPNDPEDEGWDGRSSALDMWTENPVVPYPTDLENLEILPSDAGLIKDIEAFEYSDSLESIVQRAYDFFAMDDFIECGYDLIIIDTPPAKGPLTQSAIRAATHILIPLELSNKSLQGLAGMVDLVNRQNVYRPANEQAKIIGLLKNKVDYNKRTPQTRIIDTIKSNLMLSKLLIDDIEIHDSPRAVDIDEDQAPITAPYTELKDNDRFAIEAITLGEFVYDKVLGEKENVNQEENNKEFTYV
ncbi:putative chromosome partitioning protein ParA [Legionella donaldsonii]|uniref:Putative chromosome partitioning protein ParA n=1 Tax=Legionella donaldsonii TaxID=45060 RepID=A0A378KL23_9GAMM|nr:ParA family protein [Legionella donaldsonii]STX84903.1 putative chromosome partitioning protein ParA [Legionella donaldsonii]